MGPEHQGDYAFSAGRRHDGEEFGLNGKTGHSLSESTSRRHGLHPETAGQGQ